jgi:glycosyltransferase involved in cell wall biosynthesis
MGPAARGRFRDCILISYIITARNEPAEILDRTIDGLLQTTPRTGGEVIVVDDGSEVPVRVSHPEVMLHRNSAPAGVSQSRRLGTLMASGGVFVWLDAHMTFASDWLDRMLRHVESGALLCSEFWNYELTVCHCWGADFRWCSDRNYHEQRYPGFGVQHRTTRPARPARPAGPDGDSAVDVPMVIGACYMMERGSYYRLGGFSPLFRVWGVDEQDISARAWIGGCGVKCVVGARVGHLSRSSFPYPVSYDHLEFNQLLMIRSVFETDSVRAFERFFAPIPKPIRPWLKTVNLTDWRATIQRQRRLTDREFFERFVPALAPTLRQSDERSALARLFDVLRELPNRG